MEHDLTNQEKLEEVYKMSLENNEILKGMRKRERVANFFRIFYWTVIIGAFLGVYYYISPLISVVISNKTKIEEGIKTLPNIFPELRTLNTVFDSLKNQIPQGGVSSHVDINMPDDGVIDTTGTSSGR